SRTGADVCPRLRHFSRKGCFGDGKGGGHSRRPVTSAGHRKKTQLQGLFLDGMGHHRRSLRGDPEAHPDHARKYLLGPRESKSGGWNTQAIGRFLGAFLARQLFAELSRTAFRSDHPGPILPWRMVAHVLRMPALEVGHPVAVGVLMKGDDFSLWRRTHA